MTATRTEGNAEAIAESLVEIDRDIEFLLQEMRGSLEIGQYEEKHDELVVLKRERAEIVESLEALGLEDPDL